jgi:hypothetical protein
MSLDFPIDIPLKKSLKKIAKILKNNNKKCHCTKTVGDGKILIAYLDSA